MSVAFLPAHGRRLSQRGQGAVEFALALALVLVLFLGALDMGRAFYAYIGIVNAAREGARAGMFAGSPSGIEDVVLNAIQNAHLDPSRAVVSTAWGGSGGTLTVGVQYTHNLILGTLLQMSQLTLFGSASMLLP